MYPPSFRDVIHSPEFERQLARIVQGGAERCDEFIEGIELTLARSPDSGPPIYDGSPVRMVVKNPVVPWIRPVVVFYTFSENAVYLLSIHETVEGEPNEG